MKIDNERRIRDLVVRHVSGGQRSGRYARHGERDIHRTASGHHRRRVRRRPVVESLDVDAKPANSTVSSRLRKTPDAFS